MSHERSIAPESTHVLTEVRTRLNGCSEPEPRSGLVQAISRCLQDRGDSEGVLVDGSF